jgi:hypothetical protein
MAAHGLLLHGHGILGGNVILPLPLGDKHANTHPLCS